MRPYITLNSEIPRQTRDDSSSRIATAEDRLAIKIKMNAIFMTQASSLNLFYHLMRAIKGITQLDKIGFYAADSRFFKQFKQKHPEIESRDYFLLKEWDIIRASESVSADIAQLNRYESDIGWPYLWNALVADRRIYFGKKYSYDQDYKPRFSHARMLAILQVAIQRMAKFFDDVRPDFICSFQCVTIGEYLAYLFARSRSIPFFNLRPTRIRNFFYAGESVLEPSEHLQKVYETMRQDGIDPVLHKEAANYVEDVRQEHAMYEGVVPASHKPPPKGSSQKSLWRGFKFKNAVQLFSDEFRFRFGDDKHDNHLSGSISPLIAEKIVRPWRARRLDARLGKDYIRSGDLTRLDYAFFPLHTEPEITLSVYSKPYLNQIEAVRLVSHNLPVGMTLVVKEHPWSIGKRHWGYYRKLLEIPNVRLTHPGLNSRELVSRARLITVIAGSIAFEGLIMNKPVVVLSRAPFNFLPATMIRAVQNPGDLGFEIRSLLENYDSDENALLCYIAAVMRESVPVDFYSKLLGRKGVYARLPAEDPQADKDADRSKQIDRLAAYLLRRIEGTKNHENLH